MWLVIEFWVERSVLSTLRSFRVAKKLDMFRLLKLGKIFSKIIKLTHFYELRAFRIANLRRRLGRNCRLVSSFPRLLNAAENINENIAAKMWKCKKFFCMRRETRSEVKWRAVERLKWTSVSRLKLQWNDGRMIRQAWSARLFVL